MTQTQPAFPPQDRLLTRRKQVPYCDSFQRPDIYHSLLIYKYSFCLLNVSHVSQDLKIQIIIHMRGFMECAFSPPTNSSARIFGTQGTQSIFFFCEVVLYAIISMHCLQIYVRTSSLIFYKIVNAMQ